MKRRINILEFENINDEEQVKPKVSKKKIFKPPVEEKIIDFDNDEEDYMTLEINDAANSKNEEDQSDDRYHVDKSLFENPNKSIGLSMMEKMGFVVGNSLGATKNSHAIKEPIQLRTTFGKKLQNENTYTEKEIEKLTSGKIDNARKVSEFRELRNLMKFCFELSGEADEYYESQDINEVSMLWRPFVVEKDSIEKSKKLQSVESKYDTLQEQFALKVQVEDPTKLITKLVLYLREKHKFCWYCGVSFENIEDLKFHCPGVGRDMHLY